PSLYSIYRSSSYNSSFHDIVVGNNGYPATRGWDACTGLGDPIGSGLLPKLAVYHMPTSTITVALTASVTSGAAPLTTKLTASVTSGGKAPFQYDFSPGLYLGQWTGTSSSLTYTYTSAGAYAATVEVFDANGNWSQAIPVMINVGGGHALTVGLTPSTTSATVGTPVKFVTTVSGGTGPYRLLYQWGDGTYGINGTMSEYHVYYAVGTYCPSVEAFDQGSSPTQGGVGTSSCISVVPAGPQPLTASFSATPTSGAPWLHVNFTSTVYGGSGTGRAYSWSFGDGSALSTAVNPYHIYSRAGTFQVNLTVTDSASNIAHAFGNITVALPPLATTLTATPASGLVPLTVQFGSTPTGGVAPYVASWNFGDGSIGSASPSPSHTYNASGTFPVVLVYRDSAGGWASAYTNISVTNYYSLTAYANASTTSGTVPLSVVFNGSASGGEPGYAWSWKFGDGGTSLVRNPAHTFASTGTFRVQLTVTDLQPKSASTNVTISVSPPPLTASSSASTYSGTAPLSVGFNGSAAGGTPPYSWSWNFGDTSSGTSRNPTHVYGSPGSFSAQLTVQDAAGRTASAAALTITVSSVGTVTVSASSSASTTVVGGPLTFSATASGGTAPYTWLWNFGDGTTSAQQNPTHTYSATGTYNVVASATDSGGRSGNSAPISISVGAPVPSVRIGGPASVAVGSVATFWAAASGGAGGYTYTWFFGDGTTFQSGNANTTTHTYSTACTCRVTVEVTDSASAQSTSVPLTVQVTNVGGGGSSNPFLVDGTLTVLGWGLLLALLGVILVVTFVVLHRRRSQGPPPVSPWSPPPGRPAPYPPGSYPPPPGVYSSPPPPPPPPS
ncbi:MAG: PKD domain-containing protein, partial [Euryarchaeota archaeon]|nr:PKD domain-containing protein [Euryarchaeota archaeon]